MSTETTKRLLIVDDEVEQHELLSRFLRPQGFALQTAFDAKAALEAIRKRPPHMVVMDVRMPGMDGLKALCRIRELAPTLPVLLIIAHADIKDAVRAMKDGAVDYLSKPIDLDELSAAIADAIGPGESDATSVEQPPLPPGVVVVSPAMQHVVDQCALVAPSQATVVLTGESGTGKEVLTELLHHWSNRRDGPIVKVNCAAIPNELLESELFGYEAGAFTGAVKAKRGQFEAAAGGTLFLDEIAEMSPQLQAKLLRALGERKVTRVGATAPIETDFRLITATNQDLEQAVAEKRFREDLFFRLSVIRVHVPPLRERRQDIAVLATHFARQFAQDKIRISPVCQRTLEAYP